MKIDIDRLTETKLIELNHGIVARLRFLNQMRAHSEMLEFRIGARVDQALTGHPLMPAFLCRNRLEAVRRQQPWMAGRLSHGTWPRYSRAFGCAWTTHCESSIAA